MRSVAVACLLALSACGGAQGYAAFLNLDGSADDASADEAGADDGGADDAAAGGAGGGCVASSCKACVLGTASCSDAGACQCCVLGVCVP